MRSRASPTRCARVCAPSCSTIRRTLGVSSSTATAWPTINSTPCRPKRSHRSSRRASSRAAPTTCLSSPSSLCSSARGRASRRRRASSSSRRARSSTRRSSAPTARTGTWSPRRDSRARRAPRTTTSSTMMSAQRPRCCRSSPSSYATCTRAPPRSSRGRPSCTMPTAPPSSPSITRTDTRRRCSGRWARRRRMGPCSPTAPCSRLRSA
mmetsp:Transcript_11582/g.29654  ORF Transcript_11582/g.29654 Transcript_11582/m.29654 type:complete len:209 (+) Transcript_11582:2407-3033(+)